MWKISQPGPANLSQTFPRNNFFLHGHRFNNTLKIDHDSFEGLPPVPSQASLPVVEF